MNAERPAPFRRSLLSFLVCLVSLVFAGIPAVAQEQHAGGEANLVLPRVGGETFMGIPGDTLL